MICDNGYNLAVCLHSTRVQTKSWMEGGRPELDHGVLGMLYTLTLETLQPELAGRSWVYQW